MRLATHTAFGAFLTLGVASITDLQVSPAALGLSILASTFPELDHERSEIGSLLKPISRRLAKKFGHRTFTHSFVGLGLFGLLCAPLWALGRSDLWWALFLGYLSHMLLDVLTPKGVCWFWPSLTPVGFGEARIKSGSAGESLVLISCIALSFLIYPISGVGVLGALRSAIGDIDSTFEEYRRLVGSGISVELVGELQENATKQIIKGSWPIVDLTEDGRGYWVLMGSERALRSVGREPGQDFYPLSVHLQAPSTLTPTPLWMSTPVSADDAGAGRVRQVPLRFEVSSASQLFVREGDVIEEGQLLGLKEPDPKAETVEELLISREVRSPVGGVIRRLAVEAQENGLKVEALVEMRPSLQAAEERADPGGESSRAPPEEAEASLEPRGPPRPTPLPRSPSSKVSPAEAAHSAGRIAVYFTPGDGPEQALTRLMRQVRRTIHVALYYFTDDELARALVESCSKVECKVLVDEEQRHSRYSQAALLQAQGVEVRFFEDSGIFHHKFAVFDGECVATGSYNWTESAKRRNEENLLVVCDPKVAQPYEEEFERLWADPRSRP